MMGPNKPRYVARGVKRQRKDIDKTFEERKETITTIKLCSGLLLALIALSGIMQFIKIEGIPYLMAFPIFVIIGIGSISLMLDTFRNMFR